MLRVVTNCSHFGGTCYLQLQDRWPLWFRLEEILKHSEINWEEICFWAILLGDFLYFTSARGLYSDGSRLQCSRDTDHANTETAPLKPAPTASYVGLNSLATRHLTIRRSGAPVTDFFIFSHCCEVSCHIILWKLHICWEDLTRWMLFLCSWC
jgi:hypothetical protein